MNLTRYPLLNYSFLFSKPSVEKALLKSSLFYFNITTCGAYVRMFYKLGAYAYLCDIQIVNNWNKVSSAVRFLFFRLFSTLCPNKLEKLLTTCAVVRFGWLVREFIGHWRWLFVRTLLLIICRETLQIYNSCF